MSAAEVLFARRLKIDWTRDQDGKSNSSAMTGVIRFAIASEARHYASLRSVVRELAVPLGVKLVCEQYVPQKVALEALLGSSLRFEEEIMYGDSLRRLVISARSVPRKLVPLTKEERTALSLVVKRVVSGCSALTSHDESTLERLVAAITNMLVDEYGMKVSLVENVRLESQSQLRGTFDWNGLSWRFTEPSVDQV